MRIEPRPAAQKKHVAREVRRAHLLGPLPDPDMLRAIAPTTSLPRGVDRFCAAATAAVRRATWRAQSGRAVGRTLGLRIETTPASTCHPCRSCAGTDRRRAFCGKFARVLLMTPIPRSSHIPSGLADAIGKLFNDRRLSVRWQVVAAPSPIATIPTITFSLQPERRSGDVPPRTLQDDMRIMAVRTMADLLARVRRVGGRARLGAQSAAKGAVSRSATVGKASEARQ